MLRCLEHRILCHPRGSLKRHLKDLKDKGENQFSGMPDPVVDHSSQQGWLEEADPGRKRVQIRKTATCSVWLLRHHSIGHFMLSSLLKYLKDMHAVRALALHQWVGNPLGIEPPFHRDTDQRFLHIRYLHYDS